MRLIKQQYGINLMRIRFLCGSLPLVTIIFFTYFESEIFFFFFFFFFFFCFFFFFFFLVLIIICISSCSIHCHGQKVWGNCLSKLHIKKHCWWQRNKMNVWSQASVVAKICFISGLSSICSLSCSCAWIDKTSVVAMLLLC